MVQEITDMKAIIIMTSKIKQRFVALLALLVLSGLCVAQDAAFVTDISPISLPGGDVQINIIADGDLVKPGSFSTDQPARIALDFFGAKRDLSSNLIKVTSGKVDSIVAVETPDRTRVIINLFDSARYEVVESSNGYAVTVFNELGLSDAVVTPKPFARKPDISSGTYVENIDFRRSPAGGGQLIVSLSDDDVTIDTRERDGDIVVDLLNVNLPRELEKSLDVLDFATPVQSIDSFQNSTNVRLVVIPEGRQQHISFQSGNTFTLTVDPIIQTKEEIKNEEDAALGFSGERLSINFQNIDIRSALTVIADFTGINFVTSDSVEGDITINLKDVPWDQALDVIMTAKGLGRRQTGNVIWVAPVDEIAEAAEKALAAQALEEEKAPLVSEIIQVNYANASDVSDVIKSVSLVGAGQVDQNDRVATDTNSLLTSRGSVTVDVRTNSLLVQDVASKIKELRKVVRELDKPVRQVLIETRIVEANDDFSRELGARLGFQQIRNGDVVGGTLEGNTTITDSAFEQSQALIEQSVAAQEAEIEAAAAGSTDAEIGIAGALAAAGVEIPAIEFDRTGGLGVDFGASGIGTAQAASFAYDIFRAGTNFNQLISLELSALEADGRGKIVASPKLITTNQQEASISQGTELFVNVDGGDGQAGSLEVIEAELQLIVTPRITPDDRIILDVEINQDALIFGTQAVSTTQIETQILASNGETVVIGGIYQEEISETVTKVPFLGDVPYLKALFRQKSVSNSRSELLIFLTPKIISPKLNLG